MAPKVKIVPTLPGLPYTFLYNFSIAPGYSIPQCEHTNKGFDAVNCSHFTCVYEVFQ